MRVLLAIPALVVGVVAVVVGLFLQAGGASAFVFCSVVGAGILLTVVGFTVWAVGAWPHDRPTPVGG